MQSKASSVADYLASLPPDRRIAIESLRALILKNLPEGYEEAMRWGMITYEVPLAIEPKTYNGQPLMFAALASQKNHMAVYLCSLNCVPGAEVAFVKAWQGKKLDMGKSCVRFKKLEDIDQSLIAKTVADTSVSDFIGAFKTRYKPKK